MALKYDDRFDKLENKLDLLDNKLDSMSVIQVKQQTILEEHMARTKQVEDALIPLKAQQNQIIGAGKFIGLVAVLLSIVTALIRFKS